MKSKIGLSALTLALVSFGTIPGHATDSTPRVINGQQGHPLSGASVHIDTDEADCTAGLWKPQILVTAGHCLDDDYWEGDDYDLSRIRVYPPGADIRDGWADVSVTNIFAHPGWKNDSKDIAFLTLDRPLASTPVTRMASWKEVKQMIQMETEILYIGYGVTSGRDDPDSEISNVPLWVEEPLTIDWDDFDRRDTSYSVSGNGVKGPCAGDSGGPYLVQWKGEVLFLGPHVAGTGLPCDDDGEPWVNSGVLASGFKSLMNQALAAVGEGIVKQQSCVDWGDDQECFSERSWIADICSEKRRVSLLEKTVEGWKKIATVRGERNLRDCGKKTPYVISYQTLSAPGSYSYAFKFGRNDLERFSVVVK